MNNSDLLITFASWEDRFRIGFDRNLGKVGVQKALMFYFGSYADRTLANRQVVDKVCKKKNIELIPVKVDIEKTLLTVGEQYWNPLKKLLQNVKIS